VTTCHLIMQQTRPRNTVFRDNVPVAIIDWDDDVRPRLEGRRPR